MVLLDSCDIGGAGLAVDGEDPGSQRHQIAAQGSQVGWSRNGRLLVSFEIHNGGSLCRGGLCFDSQEDHLAVGVGQE